MRPGYQVEPADICTGLPKAAKVLADFNIRIESVAAHPDETAIAACAEAGVPIIRVCADVREEETYLDAEVRWRRDLDSLVPILDRHGVRIGVQNHCNRCMGSAIGVRRLIEGYDPRHVAAVWDPAHCAIAGERPYLALDILWSHLCLVNLKNAYHIRANGPESEDVKWKLYWTTGRQGLVSWGEIADLLKAHGYRGSVCLCADYSDETSVDRLIAEDTALAKSLFP